jgi:hypothetical protein
MAAFILPLRPQIINEVFVAAILYPVTASGIQQLRQVKDFGLVRIPLLPYLYLCAGECQCWEIVSIPF